MNDSCSWDGWSHEELLKQVLNPLLTAPHITYDEKTYVATETVEKKWDVYSKSWHRAYGPKVVTSDRMVYVIDHTTLSCRLIAKLDRWPPASRTISFHGVASKVSDGPYRAIIDRIPKEDLPLLIGSQGPNVDILIERRLKKGK